MGKKYKIVKINKKDRIEVLAHLDRIKYAFKNMLFNYMVVGKELYELKKNNLFRSYSPEIKTFSQFITRISIEPYIAHSSMKAYRTLKDYTIPPISFTKARAISHMCFRRTAKNSQDYIPSLPPEKIQWLLYEAGRLSDNTFRQLIVDNTNPPCEHEVMAIYGQCNICRNKFKLRGLTDTDNSRVEEASQKLDDYIKKKTHEKIDMVDKRFSIT